MNISDIIDISILSSGSTILAIFPLFIALWGASLFKSGNTGSGFATTNKK